MIVKNEREGEFAPLFIKRSTLCWWNCHCWYRFLGWHTWTSTWIWRKSFLFRVVW